MFSYFKQLYTTIILILSVTACGQGGQGEPVDLVMQGRQLAESKCATCHAIDETSQSPRSEAPALRQALLDYDIESLGLDFEAHLQSGTDIMPAFDLTKDERDALQAFIVSLEDKKE